MLRERQYKEYMDEFAHSLAKMGDYLGVPDDEFFQFIKYEHQTDYHFLLIASVGIMRACDMKQEHTQAKEYNARS